VSNAKWGSGRALPKELAVRCCCRISEPVPDARKAIRHTLEILAIAAPLAAMTYFLFDPDAFNAFLDWLFKIH
jgi:hypothetical protein